METPHPAILGRANLTRTCRTALGSLWSRSTLHALRRLLLLAALAAVWLGAAPARAQGIAVASCDEDDLRSALAQGGYVYFTQSCSITLSFPIEIGVDTILNAQQYSVTINGGNQGPIFLVDPGITFSNIGLTITGGDTTNGGAYYILTGASV